MHGFLREISAHMASASMLSGSGAVLSTPVESKQPQPQSPLSTEPTFAPHDQGATKSLDVWMLAGIVIAVAGTIAGIKATGVNLVYFFQPAGALIVLGGTLGIALITTPRSSLRHCAHRVRGILRSETVVREELIEEIVSYAKVVRNKGLLSLDQLIDSTHHDFLRDTVRLAIDVENRE